MGPFPGRGSDGNREKTQSEHVLFHFDKTLQQDTGGESETYLWSRRRRRGRSQAQLRLDGGHRLHPDGGSLVLGAGGDGAVGGGAGCGLPLEELQDGLDVCCHLTLQSEEKNNTSGPKLTPHYSRTHTSISCYLSWFGCDLISPQGSMISSLG